jgi:hypothetical protein
MCRKTSQTQYPVNVKSPHFSQTVWQKTITNNHNQQKMSQKEHTTLLSHNPKDIQHTNLFKLFKLIHD